MPLKTTSLTIEVLKIWRVIYAVLGDEKAGWIILLKAGGDFVDIWQAALFYGPCRCGHGSY
ncbi:hypothetical protein VN23_11410 [Janthinobacterium sp. B9-8]|nr:hypothetical protein VN23_11410 [Janthinobacterium sp. B9-8]